MLGVRQIKATTSEIRYPEKDRTAGWLFRRGVRSVVNIDQFTEWVFHPLTRHRLQKGKTDVRHTLHARPTLYTMSGNVTQAELLSHLGFSFGPCAFVPGDKCIAREVPADFDVPRFARIVDSAFAELQVGITLLQECGFYIEHQLFGRALSALVTNMLSSPRGDGHNASKKQSMKQAKDASFDYRLTRFEGGTDKGWTFHYHPKHLPLSAEISSLFSFLQIRQFPECPEFDFEACGWRFCHFIPTGHAVYGAPEIAHGWFDAHAEKFSPGLQKLIDAHAILATFGFELLPSVRANVSPEVVQPPRARAKPTRTQPGAALLSSTFDVAVSFAGSQRQVAEAIATQVKEAGFDVFYDRFFPEHLWGKDLAVFFDDIFRKKARYCVIVVSKDYIEGEWTNHERQSAVERAIKEKGQEYILPIRASASDNIELPGVPGTIGYVSLSQYSVAQIAEMLIAKLRS